MASLRLTYTNKKTETVRVTAFDSMHGEEMAQKEGWNYNGYRQAMYAVYYNLRARNKTQLPFDKWMQTVERMDEVTEEPGESATVPDGIQEA